MCIDTRKESFNRDMNSVGAKDVGVADRIKGNRAGLCSNVLAFARANANAAFALAFDSSAFALAFDSNAFD